MLVSCYLGHFFHNKQRYINKEGVVLPTPFLKKTLNKILDCFYPLLCIKQSYPLITRVQSLFYTQCGFCQGDCRGNLEA